VSVIIIGEADGSAIKPASQQAAALAAQLGDSVGLVFGSNSAASQLAAPRVVSASALESYDALQFAAVAAQVARDAGATAVVMAATAMGKDLGPRLAAELGWGYIASNTMAGRGFGLTTPARCWHGWSPTVPSSRPCGQTHSRRATVPQARSRSSAARFLTRPR